MSVFRTFSTVLLIYLMVQKSCAVMIYAKVGDSVVLHPGRSFDNITSISWGHEMSPILEWFGQDIILYKSHKGRSDLEKTTGSLIIHNLTVEDTGRYTPEINRLSHNPVVLQVIEPVPKPMVHLKCNPRKTLCDLTCKANTSSRFGPVMYRWEAGNKVVSTDNQLSLTTKNQSRAYTCKVKNPVSTSSSDEVATPIKEGFHPSAVVVPVVLVVLVLVVAGGYVKHRKEMKQALNVEAAHAERTSMSLKAMRRNGMSLESFESGLTSPAMMKMNSRQGRLYLQEDEEQRLHDDQELKKQSQELQVNTDV
ncbi:natural killer cell receptor 2B4-like [Poecilia formosa]|uniref:natural killer cell receptor 2B4-like n=1 Tax=Poecilia formosa TaxID=48698 RepID=UPI0007B7DA24|nr:PREDICTED: natural killer cell receptor 2B4-like [Poecilia formosa]